MISIPEPTCSAIDRLQRQMASLFGGFPSSIRSGRAGAFPQVNIGTTDDSIEIVAFAPGVEPANLDVSIDKGLLTIGGERKPAQPEARDDTRTYAQERFTGSRHPADHHALLRDESRPHSDNCLLKACMVVGRNIG